MKFVGILQNQRTENESSLAVKSSVESSLTAENAALSSFTVKF